MSQFGRIVIKDARDAQHPMRKYLTAPPPPLQRRLWTMSSVLDQGNVGACVGYAWKGKLLAAPFIYQGGLTALTIYKGAQMLDDDPQTPPAEGTTVRAGAKYLQGKGLLGEYVWAQSQGDIVDWLLYKSPLVIGMNWYATMMKTDRKGQIKVDPQSEIMGGHALLALGIDRQRGVGGSIRLLNSWGKNWGQNGRCWISIPDVMTLVGLGGEACAAVELKAPKELSGQIG